MPAPQNVYPVGARFRSVRTQNDLVVTGYDFTEDGSLLMRVSIEGGSEHLLEPGRLEAHGWEAVS